MTAFLQLGVLREIATLSFRLRSRQELSRQANGRAIGKDFGTPIWVATYATDNVPNYLAVALEAEMDRLDGVINPFEAWDMRRPGPRAHRDGAANDGVMRSVTGNRLMALSGLKAGQVISQGDYLSFDYGNNRALHRVSSGTAADQFGVTPPFEVRPHLRPGWTVGMPVNLLAPRGLFNLVPDSLQPSTQAFVTNITFQVTQFIA